MGRQDENSLPGSDHAALPITTPVVLSLMPHGDLAQLSAGIGGLGAAAMLLSRTRAQLLAGLAVAAAGEAALAAALIPGADLKLLVSPASHAADFVVGVLVAGGG